MNLTHVDKNGKAKMVDISFKDVTVRTAYAGGWIYVGRKIIELIVENSIQKGDVLNTAKIAGIMAAKRVGELIPLCHPLNLTFVDLKFQLNKNEGKVLIFSEVKIKAQTGVEMEALTAVNIAALTIYDMCKGVDKKIFIGESYLIKKTGGKSGTFRFKEKIKGKVAMVNSNYEFDDETFKIYGILPDHLEDNDTLIVNNEFEAKVKKENGKIYIFSEKPIKEGDLICLKM